MVVLDTESYNVMFYYMVTRLDDSIHVVSDIFSANITVHSTVSEKQFMLCPCQMYVHSMRLNGDD